MNDSIRAGLDSLATQVAEGVAEFKPRLRGWLHLASAPVTLAAGVVLIALSPTATTRLGSAVYVACVGAAVHGVRGVPPRPLVAARQRGAPAPRPRQHLPAHRRHLHAVLPAAAAGHRPDRPAQRDLGRGRTGHRLPGAVDRRAPLAVRADLQRVRVCCRLRPAPVRRRVRAPRGRDRHRRAGADRRRRRCCTSSAAPSTGSAGPTRGRTASASTRCSTRSRSWRSSPTTSASRSRRTPCAEGESAHFGRDRGTSARSSSSHPMRCLTRLPLPELPDRRRRCGGCRDCDGALEPARPARHDPRRGGGQHRQRGGDQRAGRLDRPPARRNPRPRPAAVPAATRRCRSRSRWWCSPSTPGSTW